ncbi:MAG TPA: DUF4234 domain-containing protein [Kofleriaceae bacterium]
MTKRSVLLVILFSIFTFGIYHLYWIWKWCVGVEQVSRGRLSAPVAFLLMVLLGIIGTAIVQVTFNEVADQPGSLPRARVA